MPRESTGRLVSRELASENEPADQAEARIEALIAETRAEGLGRTDGEFQPGICALAAPLFDPFGRMVDAVSALGRSGKFDGAFDGAVATTLREFVGSISRKT